jgi:hypothetical protein
MLLPREQSHFNVDILDAFIFSLFNKNLYQHLAVYITESILYGIYESYTEF